MPSTQLLLIFTLIFAIATINAVKEDEGEKRIVGGTEAQNDLLPFIAVIINKETKNVLCGATILNSEWIMTIASGIKDQNKENLIIKAGTVNLTSDDQDSVQVAEAAEIHIHPNYNSNNTYEWNLALIKLNKKFDITATVQNVRLADPDWDLSRRPAQTGGFGSGDIMHVLHTTIATLEDCQQRYVNLCGDKNETICQQLKGFTEGTYSCTIDPNTDSKNGICDKDFGGPLIISDNFDYVVAINLAVIGKCGEGLSIYLNLSDCMDFIYSKIPKSELMQ